MSKIHSITAIVAVSLMSTFAANAAIFVKYEGVPGDTYGPDGTWGWFIADSFSFGVEREMKESGEKGGTADINIGIGELQDLVIGKVRDASTTTLARASLTGRGLGSVELCVTDDGSNRLSECDLHILLERAYVRSWSTSGDADDRPTEEVAFYYNKIAFMYADDPDGGVAWDNQKNRPWVEERSGQSKYR